MPTLTATQYTGQSFAQITFDAHLSDPVYVSNTTTEVVLTSASNPNLTTILTGTDFLAIDGVPAGGTLTGIEFYDSTAGVTGNLIATLTGGSFDVVTFFAALDAANTGDDTALNALLSPYDLVFDATAVVSEETTFDDTGLPLGETAIAGAGGSFMALGEFADTYIAGTGFDQISFENEDGLLGVNVNLATSQITDTYGNVETMVQNPTAFFEAVRGSQNDDTLTGSTRNETFRGLGGDDFIDGGDGTDTASYDRDAGFGGMSGVFVFLETGQAFDGFGDEDTLANIENVTGTDFDDTLEGDAADNILRGLGGDDVLFGGDGNDTLDPGDNNGGGDELQLSAGNDTYVFSSANLEDSFYTFDADGAPIPITFTINGVNNSGSIVKDTFGTDTLIDIERPLIAGDNDGGLELIAGDVDDVFNLTIDAGQRIQVNSTLGNDTFNISGDGLVIATYEDALSGIAANLVAGSITGGSDVGTDIINGPLRVVEGTAFADTFLGSAEDETFFGKGGDDAIDGGAGVDTARYNRDAAGGGLAGVFVDLSNDTVIDGFGNTDTLLNIENIVGTDNGDTIIGDAGDNFLRGLFGDDEMDGGAGNDVIDPGDNSGQDLLELSLGNDTYIFSDANLNNSFYEISADGADVSLTFTIDGAANTGSINKGIYGFDTLIDIERPLFAGFNFGGLELRGGAEGDIFNLNIDNGQFVLVRNTAGDDVYNISGGGIVRLDYSDGLGPISADLGTGVVSGGADIGTDTISGTVSQIAGTEFADSLIGSAGDDTFFTYGGGDFVDGADGSDRLRYDRDGFGPMQIDVLLATAVGTYNGVGFSDTFQSIERIRGSFADDLIKGSFVDETIEGRQGNDWVDGRAGNDFVAGGDGNDTVRGGLGNDQLSGGDGNDILVGNGGDDILDGGNGFDTVTYREATGGVTVDLTAVQDVGSGEGTDQFFNIENVDGGFFDDTITGDALQNVLRGQAGNDTINGGDGEDFLYGGIGNDTIVGGEGADFIYAENDNDTVNGGNGADYIQGGSGVDTIHGGNGDDSLHGDFGNDTIFGDDGMDNIFGGAGWDKIQGGNQNDSIFGGTGNDRLFGNAGDDSLFGEIGSDTLFGGAGNDLVRGGSGNDSVDGDAGNDRVFGDWGEDIIFGGTGDNTLFGGNGRVGGDNLSDVFIFKSAANGGTNGVDTIRDFEDGIDLLDLSDSGYTGFIDVFNDATDVGANLQIDWEFGGLLIIENFQKSEFDVTDVVGL